MKANEIVNLPRSLWAKVGGKAATKIVKDSDKGFGTKNRKRYKFDSYTAKYSTLKAKGKAGAKGVSKSSQSAKFKIDRNNAKFNISAKANKYWSGYCVS